MTSACPPLDAPVSHRQCLVVGVLLVTPTPPAAEITKSPGLIVPLAVILAFTLPVITVQILPAAAPTLTMPTHSCAPVVGETVPGPLM